jgi:hypothetical protein
MKPIMMGAMMGWYAFIAIIAPHAVPHIEPASMGRMICPPTIVTRMVMA